MRVAFDIDGVLRDLMAAYVPHLAGQRSVAEITDYDKAVVFAGSIDQFYAILDNEQCWRKASPYFSCLALYREIKKLNHSLVLVTGNPSWRGQIATLEWLRAHEIVYDEMHFCSNKLYVAFDALVEDNPDTAYAAACSGRAAFLVKRPWTVSSGLRHSNLFRLPPDEEAAAVILDVLAGRGWRDG